MAASPVLISRRPKPAARNHPSLRKLGKKPPASKKLRQKEPPTRKPRRPRNSKKLPVVQKGASLEKPPPRSVKHVSVSTQLSEKIPSLNAAEKKRGKGPQKQTAAMDRACELQTSLPSTSPSFVKAMRRSHVSGCYWMGLPVDFCVEHLPKNDETMHLKDAEGEVREEQATNFLWRRTGLSGGWKGFSRSHHLVEGDALVFQLIEASRFKNELINLNPLLQVAKDDEVATSNIDG